MGAFEEVYRQYYRQVYFYVLGLCRNEHIAEEITQETFFKVLKQMDTFREEYKGKVQAVMYDTESFSYPAYVTINANDHCYEYALLLGDEGIAYVFPQFIKEEEIVFPTEYLPDRYEETKDGYSIYIFYGENGDGYWGSSLFLFSICRSYVHSGTAVPCSEPPR